MTSLGVTSKAKALGAQGRRPRPRTRAKMRKTWSRNRGAPLPCCTASGMTSQSSYPPNPYPSKRQIRHLTSSPMPPRMNQTISTPYMISHIVPQKLSPASAGKGVLANPHYGRAAMYREFIHGNPAGEFANVSVHTCWQEPKSRAKYEPPN